MNLQLKYQQQCVVKLGATRCFSRKAVKYQQGLTLVELLIAIALGLFLTWGAIQAFLTGKQTYTVQQSLSRIQESGRMAKEFLNYDIRTAGQLGGGSIKIANNEPSACSGLGVSMLNNSNRVEYAFGRAVYGANNVPANATGGMVMAGALNPTPIANTDILVTQTAVNVGQTLAPPAAPSPPNWAKHNFIDVNNNCINCMVNGIYAVSDMTHTKIFQGTAVNATTAKTTITHAGGLNACSTWQLEPAGIPPHIIAQGADVWRMDMTIYYVGVNATTNRPSLYRYTSLSASSEELLEGVEDMQLEFGLSTEDSSGVPKGNLTYKTADTVLVGEWDSVDGGNPQLEAAVRSVRYSLLVRAEDDFTLATPQQYTYPPTITGAANTAVTTAPDRRMRQIFSGTVAIRNRSK